MKTNASYPSGHAMIAWSWAMVLSELLPPRNALAQSGRDFAQAGDLRRPLPERRRRRPHPRVGHARREHAEPAFQSDLAAARAEVAAARPRGRPRGARPTRTNLFPRKREVPAMSRQRTARDGECGRKTEAGFPDAAIDAALHVAVDSHVHISPIAPRFA